MYSRAIKVFRPRLYSYFSNLCFSINPIKHGIWKILNKITGYIRKCTFPSTQEIKYHQIFSTVIFLNSKQMQFTSLWRKQNTLQPNRTWSKKISMQTDIPGQNIFKTLLMWVWRKRRGKSTLVSVLPESKGYNMTLIRDWHSAFDFSGFRQDLAAFHSPLQWQCSLIDRLNSAFPHRRPGPLTGSDVVAETDILTHVSQQMTELRH